MGLCTWSVDRSCLPDPGESVEDGLKLQAAIDAAVLVLWAFTGRQYACCPVIARPCISRCDDGRWTWGPGWYPVLENGEWRNISCSCGGKCKAVGPAVVHLPGPVCEIVSVKVDGVEIDESSYVLEGDRLYRRAATWPEQDLTVPDGDPGTWSVEYLKGTPPPAGAASMVGQLAKEFHSACTDGKCKLPRRVQTIQRRGVTLTMVDPQSVIDQGITGVPQIDTWVTANNKNRLMQPPQVSSPDGRFL